LTVWLRGRGDEWEIEVPTFQVSAKKQAALAAANAGVPNNRCETRCLSKTEYVQIATEAGFRPRFRAPSCAQIR